MSRFGDNATGPSNLEISNIAGVSAQINALASHVTAISNLGPVATQIGDLGTTDAIADMADLSPQAVRDNMAALANVTTELGLLGTSAMADASTGYITALATSTVGATSQLSIDALGQLATEIGLLGNNLTTLQNSAANSPIQISNLSDVTFANLQNGQALVYNSTSGDWENDTVSAGSVSTSNISEVAAATPTAAGEVIRYDGTSAWTVGQLDYSEILNPPSLQPLATTAAFADLNEAAPNGTAGDVIHHDGSVWTQGQLASTELSDTADLVRNNAGATLTGDYTISGNLDVTNGEIRVDTIDPDPHGVNDAGGPGTLTILGNLQVDGTTTTINTQDLLVTDSTIVVAKDATNASAANGAGFEIGNYASNPAFLYDGSAADKFTLNRDLDVGTNQLYFSNVFSTTGDLPSASSYHGMFAHVHNEGAAYFAHDGSWQELQNDITTATALDAASLSTQVNSTATDVRRAAVTTTTSADLTGDAQLFNVTASGVTLTLKDSVLNTGDIVTIYANGNNVTIANANVSTADGFDTVKIDGTTSAHTGNITVANGSMATVSVISATAGSSLVVVAGQGVS